MEQINDHVFAYVGPLGNYQELKLCYFHPASPFGNISLSLSPFSVEKGMFSESGKRSWLQVSCSETTKNHTPVTHCSGLTSSRSLQVTSFVFFGFFDIHDSAEEAGQIVPKARTQTLEGETEPGRVWPFGCVFFHHHQLHQSNFGGAPFAPLHGPHRWGFKDLTRWKRC